MSRFFEIFLDGNGQYSFIRVFGAFVLIVCTASIPLAIVLHEAVAIVSLAGIITGIFACKAIQTKFESKQS